MKGGEETKWNILLAFICSKTLICVCMCALFDFVRDALVTGTFFCRDSIWVMPIWAGVLDLRWAIWFESTKEPL